ncbi:hypothetical protein LY78DRAFT_620972 [Colletotrichum sublineola]|uniref:Uncharacterized protein n=1 Tax=Colletotrichum sublineola TaxID=1173701 RepID=A0A066XPE3_COLSU|nr:hypothetical protein LY78DRAFT_620972 [Colletotrichum sublineola]KDN69559.1 hypothetical protein CSUB01_12535 [Colletotrichum sublineola]
MHRSVILAALASLATSSLAAVAGHALLPRDNDCGKLNDVPLSPDPGHSTYTFILDPSVKDVITNLTQTSGSTFNMIQVDQYCNKFNGDGGYEAHNFGYTNITGFGPDSKYTVTTPKCDDGESRSPLSFAVFLCTGNGENCQGTPFWAACGLQGTPGGFRPICPVTEPSGGNPKAVAVNDPTAWSCQVCTTIRTCQFAG